MLDISSLAACFTAYGHHPLLYTVNRLKPRPNTQATLLGNFASIALDDIIHDPQVTLQQSLARSYREQAERFAACEDFNQETFEQAAAVVQPFIRIVIAADHQDVYTAFGKARQEAVQRADRFLRRPALIGVDTQTGFPADCFMDRAHALQIRSIVLAAQVLVERNSGCFGGFGALDFFV